MDVERVKQKTAEALKCIKIYEFKNCLSSEKNVWISVLHQMKSTLKVHEFEICKNKYTIFINKF